MKIAVSTCPNDTFIFGAILKGLVTFPANFNAIMDDVQLLNSLAMKEKLDMVKISFGAFPFIKNNYKILHAGAALGFGCGPLLLSKNFKSIDELKGKKIAIPGVNTTAFMVFKRFFSDITDKFEEMRFDYIMPALQKGLVDAGLVIHEGRFTFQNYGLSKVLDMGEVWESKLDLPLPLGCIVLHRNYFHLADSINTAIRTSLDYAYNNRQAIIPFIKQYAKDMQDEVISSHIGLYVNKFSYSLDVAKDAISKLLNIEEDIFI